MKSLLFFRHGKSDWEADYGHDHDRPLAQRGRKAAHKMGKFLARIDQMPDSIVSSSAVRARGTVAGAMKSGHWPECAIRVTQQLYGATQENVLKQICSEADSTERLMLVGHEPALSGTISSLIGGGSVHFPTAALARVDLDIEHWQNASFGIGSLRWFVVPRALP